MYLCNVKLLLNPPLHYNLLSILLHILLLHAVVNTHSIQGSPASPLQIKQYKSLYHKYPWLNLQNPCPMSFHWIGGGCYFYGYFALNWFRAAEFCHSFGKGVTLAALETQHENLKIKRWLLVNGDHQSGVWVSGSENGHKGKWAWFSTGQLIDYSNWGPSQPSGKDQHCMYLVGGVLGYQWADFHCEFDMNFLCEYDAHSSYDRHWK